MLSDYEKKLLTFIDKDELVELTRSLIKIDSVIRPETGNTEAEVVRFIADWIRTELKMEPEINEAAPGRENIILRIDSGKPGKTLMFEGHTDVVSEGDRSLWKHNPFAADIEDGKIYGRGSCDMKAGVAVNLITAKALLNSGADFKGSILLGILCDEEDLMLGVQDFIKKGHADNVDACLVSEPEENQLCISMKGALRIKLTVHGKMAHGAMPLTGINPNTRLAKVIVAFEEFESLQKKKFGKDEYLGWPSVTFTVIQSPPPPEPPQLNVMPGEAVAYVDIRTVPGQKHTGIQKSLAAIIDDLGSQDSNFDVTLEYLADKPVVSMGKGEPIVVAAASVYQDVTGKPAVYNGVPGATDGTFLRDLKGIPCLVNGPGPRHLPHQTDEYVEIDELIESAELYLLTALRFLK
ncbi:MAG: M20 family peptidase [Spirochaetes bacterium]|nr:MAG: M20 family peptidase [Spirochaetota bacterium]